MLGLYDRQGLVLREELDVPGIRRAHGQEQRLGRGDGPAGRGLVAGVGGTVLCTSSTSMFAIASSVQGNGSVELVAAAVDTFVMLA